MVLETLNVQYDPSAIHMSGQTYSVQPTEQSSSSSSQLPNETTTTQCKSKKKSRGQSPSDEVPKRRVVLTPATLEGQAEGNDSEWKHFSGAFVHPSRTRKAWSEGSDYHLSARPLNAEEVTGGGVIAFRQMINKEGKKTFCVLLVNTYERKVGFP